MAVADKVRKATPDDLPEISSALSTAFFDDPLTSWALPDDDRRQRLLPEFFALFTRAFLRHHQTYTGPRHQLTPPRPGHDPRGPRHRLARAVEPRRQTITGSPALVPDRCHGEPGSSWKPTDRRASCRTEHDYAGTTERGWARRDRRAAQIVGGGRLGQRTSMMARRPLVTGEEARICPRT